MVIDKLNKYNILFLIVIISFIIRFLFRSNYLDDWDSVQFALAIKDYSIPAHQPHPPGYPIYIFLGRVVDVFFNDPVKSLIFLSVFFGTISIIITYLLAEKLFDKNVAILSSIILSLSPAHLLFSEVAMTDIVSLFFVAVTIYLLYLGIESKKYLYIGSFFLGITTGIRLTDIILVSILFIVLIYRRKLKESLKESIISIILIVIGISIWLIPIIIDTGFDTLIEVEKSQYEYNNNTNTINELGILQTIGALIIRFVDGWSYIFFIFILITSIFIILKILKILKKDREKDREKEIKNDRKEIFYYISDKRIIFLIILVLSYSIYSTLYNSLYISRYLLPQFVPLSIIFSYSMINVLDLIKTKYFKMLLSIIFAILIILMGFQSITGAYDISTTKPAPVQAAELIKKNYDYNNTIIIAKDSNRHLQYYLPNFNFLRFEDTPDKISDYVNKTIISEGSPVAFVPSKVYTFKRPKIYPKHQYVLLYENKYLQRQFIMLERDGWVEFGTFGNMMVRRMETDAILRLYSDNDNNTNISFNIIGFYRPRTLEIFKYNDDNDKKQVNINTDFNTVTIPTNLKKGLNDIRLHVVEGCERPIDHPELKNKDTRCLSIAFATKYR